MNLSDFITAIQAILLLRLNIDQWAASDLMRNNLALIERHFNDGWSPVESVSVLVGRELPEYFGAPDGSKIFGAY